jgi:hypothetical protein
MNFIEADKLVEVLNEKNCGGTPLAVSETPSNSVFGNDSAVVACRLNFGLPCVFAGGLSCPKGFKVGDLNQ